MPLFVHRYVATTVFLEVRTLGSARVNSYSIHYLKRHRVNEDSDEPVERDSRDVYSIILEVGV